ncbi:glycosyltransferase family 2 protein [Ornithinimicrobium sp. W1679]|uniref:glycosyltransferase family 2 protein n=1 Tax=Ornithinimicrobium sp. W1679 TaxID=3418770 RepID=UPI003CEFE3A4
MTPTLAVLTMTRGNHEQLLGQVDGISVGSRPTDLHVVVSMGDRDLTRNRLPLGTDRWRTVVRPVQTDRRALPYAAARNLAAGIAIEEGAEVLVFLSASTIPGGRTLERYVEAVTGTGAGAGGRPELDGPTMWCGPLLELPPPENSVVGYPFGQLRDVAVPTPGTPALTPGQFEVDRRWELCSGCAFAMSAQDWQTVGGYSTDYVGHGLEDVDFARAVHEAGGARVWVGGATAYRQPVPDVAVADEVRIALRHASVWRERWGAEADVPWLQRLQGQGHVRRDRSGRFTAA